MPKVVVLGDATSIYTDDILDGDPILHHMITTGKNENNIDDVLKLE